MSSLETIDIPINDEARLKIKAPHLARYRRWSYNDGLDFYGAPVVKAFGKTGLMPLPPNLAARIADAGPRVQLVPGRKPSPYFFESEVQTIEPALRARMDDLAKGKKPPEDLGSLIEHLFRRVFTPEDFTFDQKIKLFDYFAGEVVEWADREYADKVKKYETVGYPVSLVSENCTLKEWKESLHGRVDTIIKNWLEAQKAIRDLASYDWQPLEFIFGDHINAFAQVKTATLNAEVKVSYDAVMREYHDFLGAVEKASQLGAMRANSTQLESVLLGKYKIWLYIHDTGKGAAFARDVNQMMEPVKDVASFFSWTIKSLFGKS